MVIVAVLWSCNECFFLISPCFSFFRAGPTTLHRPGCTAMVLRGPLVARVGTVGA